MLALRDHLADDRHCTNWLVELDRPLDPGAVADALGLVRPAFPLHFARVRPEGSGPVALPEPERPIREFLAHRSRCEGGARAFSRALGNARLHPVESGLFRCHCVDGPTPLLAFQVTHVPGDGYTNHVFRQAFAGALESVLAGHPRAVTPPAGAHAVPLEELQQKLPMDPRAMADLLPRAARLVVPRMTSPAGAQGPACELRTFRATVDPARYARLVAHASALRITPVALLGASLAAALRECMDPWEQRPGDFFALSVPRDFRALLGREAQIGNLAWPQGIPLFADDPAERDPLALLFFDRLQRGRSNRMMYRHFMHRLREALQSPLAPAPPPELRTGDGRLALDPLPLLGVTEIPRWGELEALGPARILDTFVHSPMMSRRFASGRVHLGCTVRWHAAFDTRIRHLLEGFLRHLFGDEPVDWELL